VIYYIQIERPKENEMRNAETVKTTNDSRTYKRAVKRARDSAKEVCGFCPYHRGENAGRRRPRKHSRRDHRRG
jgi:hypothetical protein